MVVRAPVKAGPLDHERSGTAHALVLGSGGLAVWFLSTAVDRQFIFFGLLALSFPAGFLVYGAAPVGVAVEELFHLDLWVLWNALMWVAVVVAGVMSYDCWKSE